MDRESTCTTAAMSLQTLLGASSVTQRIHMTSLNFYSQRQEEDVSPTSLRTILRTRHLLNTSFSSLSFAAVSASCSLLFVVGAMLPDHHHFFFSWSVLPVGLGTAPLVSQAVIAPTRWMQQKGPGL